MSETIEAPRLPLAVRPSRLKPWIGFGFAVVFVVGMFLVGSETLKPAAMLLGGAFLLIVALVSLVGMLDRRPRLVLDHDGLHWRTNPGKPLRFTPWSQLRSVGYRADLRHHDTGWLELDITGPESVRASIPLSSQSPWGQDLPDIVRAIAPHVSLIDFDD